MAKARTVYSKQHEVGQDYDGLSRALESDYANKGRVELRLADIHRIGSDGSLFRLQLRRGSLEAMDVTLGEGWIIEPGPRSARAMISHVDYDEDTLLVHCTAPRPSNNFASTVWASAPDFLAKLRDWLSLCQGRPLPHLLERLSANSPGNFASHAVSGKLRDGQRRLIEALGDHMAYLWGPPGTGKTFTLARAVTALARNGYKVALLAPTNTAVDTAVLAIRAAYLEAGRPLVGGELVRAGLPAPGQLDDFPELLAWQQSLVHHQRLLRQFENRQREIQRLLPVSEREQRERLTVEVAELKREALDCRQSRADELWRLASRASILATTVYSGLHRAEMQAFFAHEKVALVIDEAAMVPRYALLPLLELLGGGEAPQGQLSDPPTRLSVLLAGDPRQLGPIHQQSRENDVNQRYWMGESLMEHLLERAPSIEERVCLLDEQSRMDRSICRRISTTYYGGALRTLPCDDRPYPPIAWKWPDDGVVVVDPKQVPLPDDAPPERLLDAGPKFNERSLQVAVRLIREALRDGADSVLWLTPFREQARLARKFVDIYFSDAPVRAGTVHSSQGGEADLVIFDPVSPRHRWLKGLMAGELDIERMLNVAVSRARGQAVILAGEKDLKANPLFWRLLHDAHRWNAEAVS